MVPLVPSFPFPLKYNKSKVSDKCETAYNNTSEILLEMIITILTARECAFGLIRRILVELQRFRLPRGSTMGYLQVTYSIVLPQRFPDTKDQTGKAS